MENKYSCKYFKDCGSCKLLNHPYKETLDLKLKMVNDCLKKEHIKYNVNDIIASPRIISYRNKMIIGFKNIKGNIIAGFYEEGSHRIVNIDKCIMHTDIQNQILSTFVALIKKMHYEIYDEDKRVGLIRYLLIREGFQTKEVMVTIVTSNDIFPGCKNIVKELLKTIPSITTIIQNINPRKTSIVLGEKQKVLFGKGYISDYIGNIKYNISSKSFFQVNPLQANNLYNEIINAGEFSGDEKVIDAYSGVASIACFIAKKVKEVYAIENNKDACQNAISNIKNNNIKNVQIINADSTEFLKQEAINKNEYDVVILDPPRSGSTEEFIKCVRKVLAKKVIYVSCEPSTLARDLGLFIKEGYAIKSTKCFDMFCYSEHIETIVGLYLKG